MKDRSNPFAYRLGMFRAELERSSISAAMLCDRANIRSLTGADCDSAILFVEPGARGRIVLYTDFRYIPEMRRTAPWLKTDDIKKINAGKIKLRGNGGSASPKAGVEFSIPHSRFLSLKKAFPGARFVDAGGTIRKLRAVKTAAEIEAIRRAVALNDEIWSAAKAEFAPGMSEIDMARTIKRLMVERGDGEAFETIVCIGSNAAECHHTPDGTRWDGREAILVDMGVKLDGYCSDMTRCIPPARPSKLYREIYSLVDEANKRAVAALRPGMTGRELDAVARSFLAGHGYKKEFGHSLGHGVGLEIHEMPGAGSKSETKLEPGMTVTIEPGVYIPGKLGVRIEDLAVVTETGCEVLTRSEKAKV